MCKSQAVRGTGVNKISRATVCPDWQNKSESDCFYHGLALKTRMDTDLQIQTSLIDN